MSNNRIAPLPPALTVPVAAAGDVKAGAQLASTPAAQQHGQAVPRQQLPPLPGQQTLPPLQQQTPLPLPAQQALTQAMHATPSAMPSPALVPIAPPIMGQQQPLMPPVPPQPAPATAMAQSVATPVAASAAGAAGDDLNSKAEGVKRTASETSLSSYMNDLVQAAQQFIPFRYVDLRESLMQDYPDVFRSDETRRLFVKLSRWLAMRNSMRLAVMFDDVYDLYSFVDPDNDAPSGIGMTDQLAENYMAKFQKMFLDVLDKGNFVELDQSIINTSYGSAGFLGTGMAVKPVDTTVLEYRVWYRGVEVKTVQYRTWRTFFMKRSQRIVQFDRLTVMYRRRPKAEEEANLEKLGFWRRVGRWIFEFMFNPKELSCSDDMAPGRLYIKFFKDVQNSDIDIMLPGAEAKFSWLDYTLIAGSILAAIGGAVYKAITGTIRFDSVINILTTLVLILMPLYSAYKGYVSIKEKMQDLQFYVNRIFVTHNLSSNSGVIATVLDEAQEQEDKEALLAYFFLWQGLKAPAAMSKEDLDRSTEAYLNSLAQRQELEIKLDFEVVDGIDKLSRMDILEEITDQTTLYKVLPLEEAADKAHISKFDEEREVQAVKRRNLTGIKDGLFWHECVGTYPATGQKFRYFWNVKTGESTYIMPREFIPLVAEGLVMPAHTTPPLKQA